MPTTTIYARFELLQLPAGAHVEIFVLVELPVPVSQTANSSYRYTAPVTGSGLPVPVSQTANSSYRYTAPVTGSGLPVPVSQATNRYHYTAPVTGSGDKGTTMAPGLA